MTYGKRQRQPQMKSDSSTFKVTIKKISKTKEAAEETMPSTKVQQSREDRKIPWKGKEKSKQKVSRCLTTKIAEVSHSQRRKVKEEDADAQCARLSHDDCFPYSSTFYRHAMPDTELFFCRNLG